MARCVPYLHHGRSATLVDTEQQLQAGPEPVIEVSAQDQAAGGEALAASLKRGRKPNYQLLPEPRSSTYYEAVKPNAKQTFLSESVTEEEKRKLAYSIVSGPSVKGHKIGTLKAEALESYIVLLFSEGDVRTVLLGENNKSKKTNLRTAAEKAIADGSFERLVGHSSEDAFSGAAKAKPAATTVEENIRSHQSGSDR